jgi:hypothetical protein
MWREFENLAYLSCLLFPMYRFMKDQCFLTANIKEQDHSVGMVALLHNGDLSAFTYFFKGCSSIDTSQSCSNIKFSNHDLEDAICLSGLIDQALKVSKAAVI